MTELVELVDLAKAGDREAFDEIVRLTYKDTYTLARRLAGNDEDAHDIVQEAYIKAYRNIGGFRGEAAFSTWMYRVTANAASTYLSKRSNKRHERITEEMQVVDERRDIQPEIRAEALIEGRILAHALDSLPDNLRQVIILRDVYEMTHEEIAEELGINEATAKVRLHRARKKLKDRLFGGSSDEGDIADAV
jgi:RNA polymerase sigma-70 factor (ECF subfamily)